MRKSRRRARERVSESVGSGLVINANSKTIELKVSSKEKKERKRTLEAGSGGLRKNVTIRWDK